VLGQLGSGNYSPLCDRKLISLWDIMKAFLITPFQGLAWNLGYTEGSFKALAAAQDGLVQPEAQKSTADTFEIWRSEVSRIGLPVTTQHIAEEIENLRNNPLTRKQIGDMASAINDSLRREMKAMKLFCLSGETQHYYEAISPFGSDVASAFPSAEYEIGEAGNCLSLGRSTASVFHSMRVLEHGLKALAAEFNVPY